jgi:hypothetical protein
MILITYAYIVATVGVRWRIIQKIQFFSLFKLLKFA